MKFEAEVNIDYGIDQPDGIDPNIFLTAEPHTGDTCKYSDVFQPAGVFHPFQKLLPDCIHISSKVLNDFYIAIEIFL
jgi:hypothetical protein